MAPYSDIDVQELLPQQPPFRFVDTLEWYSEEESLIAFTPGEGNLLMEDGHLSAAGIMEHMAQANAVREGYRSKYILHIPVSIGFIGQIRDCKIFRLPKAGERLLTTVHLKYEMFKVCLADVEARSGEELIAYCNLKTALKND